MNWKNILIFGGITAIGVVGYFVLRGKPNKGKSAISNKPVLSQTQMTKGGNVARTSSFTGESIL